MDSLDTEHRAHAALKNQAQQEYHNFTQGLIMWACAAAFYSFQFFIRVSPNVMTHQLMASFDIQACTLGTMVSFYYWGYSLMQIPAGVMLDSIGPRRPLTFACLLCFLGCLSFALGGSVFFLSLGRVLIGVGSAFGFLTAVRIISTWFKAEKLGLFVGMTVLIGTMGAVGGSSPLAHLLTVTSWQNCILILAGCSAVLAVMAWTLIRDHGPQTSMTDKTSISLTHILLSIGEIVKNPQTWIYAAYGFLMYVPLAGFADLWGTPFLSERFGIDHTVASQGIFTFYIGMGVGCVFWPLTTVFFKSYRAAMALSAACMLGFIMISFYMVSLTFFQVCLTLGATGFCAGGQFIAFSGVTDINPRDRAATASGMHNMLCMFSGNLMQPLLGYLLHHHWSERRGELMQGVPSYTLSDFDFALTLIPLSLLLATLTVAAMKETYPKVRVG